MGRNRRLAMISTTDSEGEEEGEFKSGQFEFLEDEHQSPPLNNTKKKNRKLLVEEDEDEEDRQQEQPDEAQEEEEEEAVTEDAKPIGVVMKESGKGRNKRTHYEAFEYDGNRFELEDSVLLTPEERGQKPYVAIIKDITQGKDGSMMVLGQWFYRPEEAEKRDGGSWEARDTRELFYSFHRDEVPAESVMHKCLAHFVPLDKQFPDRSVHPGFIIQKVYDTVEKKLWKLTDKDYEDSKQHEINILVQKTRERLGELLDLPETEQVADPEDQLKDRRGVKRKDIAPLDVSREEMKSDEQLTLDTPGSCTGEASEHYKILVTFKALTGESSCDKWLEKLLQAIQFVLESKENVQDGEKIHWPDAVVPVVVSLVKTAHDTFDFQKFNQKMRKMAFNLRGNYRLASRLINKELEASVVLNMTPNELKEGLTAQETATKEPEESERMQMTDARCKRCQEKKVGLTDIIQAGARGDRYQLECIACGNTWYAFRDEVSTLTIDAPSVVGNVGTAPWATDKFEAVEKKLVSPRESEKPSPDIFRKTSAVLDNQRSFKKPRAEDPSLSRNKTE
ncbi:bromo-adjacent-like protein [Thalictrum thalictroides]|uniref:Bromo-adjacent-like protein n=1 Tax=Thalictrum thalictroides TaxID=46969 RepID=A0A7J6WPC2_THATH|nr:bromo-adjacent-like protein [Thalictrum thalictroides]